MIPLQPCSLLQAISLVPNPHIPRIRASMRQAGDARLLLACALQPLELLLQLQKLCLQALLFSRQALPLSRKAFFQLRFYILLPTLRLQLPAALCLSEGTFLLSVPFRLLDPLCGLASRPQGLPCGLASRSQDLL